MEGSEVYLLCKWEYWFPNSLKQLILLFIKIAYAFQGTGPITWFSLKLSENFDQIFFVPNIQSMNWKSERYINIISHWGENFKFYEYYFSVHIETCLAYESAENQYLRSLETLHAFLKETFL